MDRKIIIRRILWTVGAIVLGGVTFTFIPFAVYGWQVSSRSLAATGRIVSSDDISFDSKPFSPEPIAPSVTRLSLKERRCTFPKTVGEWLPYEDSSQAKQFATNFAGFHRPLPRSAENEPGNCKVFVHFGFEHSAKEQSQLMAHSERLNFVTQQLETLGFDEIDFIDGRQECYADIKADTYGISLFQCETY